MQRQQQVKRQGQPQPQVVSDKRGKQVAGLPRHSIIVSRAQQNDSRSFVKGPRSDPTVVLSFRPSAGSLSLLCLLTTVLLSNDDNDDSGVGGDGDIFDGDSEGGEGGGRR